MRHHLPGQSDLSRVGDGVAKKPGTVQELAPLAHIRDARQEAVALDERQVDTRGDLQRLHEGGGAIGVRDRFALDCCALAENASRREGAPPAIAAADQLHLASEH